MVLRNTGQVSCNLSSNPGLSDVITRMGLTIFGKSATGVKCSSHYSIIKDCIPTTWHHQLTFTWLRQIAFAGSLHCQVRIFPVSFCSSEVNHWCNPSQGRWEGRSKLHLYLPHSCLGSFIRSYQYGLAIISFVLWVITQYYCIFLLLTFSQHWPLGTLSGWLPVPLTCPQSLCFFKHCFTSWDYKALLGHIVFSLPQP